MTKRLRSSDPLDRTTSDALRGLDPAADVDPQLASSPRAQQTLTRILATDSAGPALPPVRTGWARGPGRRWVVAGAALVGVGALVVVPGLIADRFAVSPAAKSAVVAPRKIAINTEFASWTATGKAATPAEFAAGGKKCMSEYAGPGGVGPGSDGKMVAQAKTFLVERRGVWTFVILIGPGENGRGGFQASCLIKDYAAATANGPDTSGGGGGGGQAASYEEPPVVLAPNVVEVTTGGGCVGTESGSTCMSIGRTGSDVASVIINTIERGPVTATIQDGYFAAWWPGPPMDMHWPKAGEPAPPEPPMATYTLILKDGTIRAGIPQKQLYSKRQ